ncbi:lipopolysaccharide biosynthesis protein [Acetobacter fallax]|uniref:Oligosaccharide flippase family protein n=2 Tax=Acetobacter fallax TaxID=1737473 RepID=A0ABX0KAD1_9PROT|nr:lipopolysaccharide biosynthesis protein [Acetobacter fallax]NHO32915.1 oligosaccharide flippase family protein [Acetobacter fallax]NHO36477.1 oligosaccharide flippase family protein [Acetobacter fallax]
MPENRDNSPENQIPAIEESTGRPISPQRRIVRNVSTLMAGRALNAPMALLHTSLAVRLLGAYDFGLVVLLYAFARTLADVVTFQSWQTVLNFGSGALAAKDTSGFHRIIRFSFVLDAISGITGMVLGIAITSLGRAWLGWPASLSTLGPLYCLSIPFMASATPTGILRLLDQYKLISAQSIVATVVRLAGTLILWVTHGSLIAMTLIWITADVMAAAILNLFALQQLAKAQLLSGIFTSDITLRNDLFHGRLGKSFPGIWQFAITTNINTTLTLAFSHIGTLIIGGMLGPVSASYYRIGSQLAAGIAKPAILVQSTLYPEMARLRTERNTGSLYALALRAALAAGALGSTLLALAWFLGGPALRLVIGPHGTEALPVTLWLLAAEVIAIWGLPLEPLLFTMRRIRAVIVARSVDALLYLPLLVITLDWYGLDGAGPAILAATVFLVLMQLGFVLRMKDTVSSPPDSRTME